MAKSFALTLAFIAAPAWAQWTHRYPKVEGYRHHVYLEGFELPILAAGPTDPAPSPDGRSLAFAARGWLWLLDLDSAVATRLTHGSAMDSRPTWSADGRAIAFVRDDTSDLDIWVLDLVTGEESVLVETPAIDLDPAYSKDGTFLYYSSAEAGDLDLWRLQIATRERMQLTSSAGLEVRPLPRPGNESVVFVDKRRSGIDRIAELEIASGTVRELMAQSIISQTHPGLSGDGNTLAVNWPGPSSAYDLWLVDLRGGDPIRLNARPSLPLSPAFSADGKTLYFVQASDALEFHLHRVSVTGGEIEHVRVRVWDWKEATAQVRIRTPGPSRLEILDGDGHPAVLPEQVPRFDSTHGKVYVYSPGVVTATVPAGNVSVRAAQGFSAVPTEATVRAGVGEAVDVEIAFERLWDPRSDGWYSGDHHYHMNYGGPYQLAPDDLVLPLQGEDVDVGTPLMANLHHRFNDLEFFGDRRLGRGRPLVAFGQEIRSHFLGHVGIINIDTPFWPWYWGPGYPVYGQDDRPNVDVLRHAREQGGISSYMHPVSVADPFADETGLGAIPVDLIPDAVLGDLDALEIACLWISELGTAEVWHRFLNVGAVVAASAGTDSFADYFRSMAVGATRIYVKVDGPFHLESYLDALEGGRSFVSTGPLIDFRVDGALPGDVVPKGEGALDFELRVATAVPVERVEVLVNGEPVWSESGLAEPGERRYGGSIDVPDGGWIAARAYGGEERWPGMNGFPYAHSSPIWLEEKGSTDPEAARAAAKDLLRALDVAHARLREGYAGVEIPRLEARFAAARQKLEQIAAPDPTP